MITGNRRRRHLALLGAGLLGSLALAACGGSEVEGQASAASSGSASSSTASSSSASSGSASSGSASSGTGASDPAASSADPSGSAGSSGAPAGGGTGALDDAEDLSAGLLPAEAFGAGARVTPVTADQIEQQAQFGGLGTTQDLSITPEACAPAVQSIQPGLDDVAGLGAQTATAGSTTTVQVLAEGEGIAGGVEQLAATAQDCPQATITSPQIGTAQVAFAALDVPQVGDAAAGLSMTLSVTGPNGQPVTVPLLLAMARDGDRLISLTQTDMAGAADPAAFAGLLQQAFDRQAGALD